MRGVLKAKFLEEMILCMKIDWISWGEGGGRVQNKKPSMGGVWIFSGTAHSDATYAQKSMMYKA